MIEILSGGLQTTIQDLGRFHAAHIGVSRAGAADPLALRVGNALVSNAPHAAAFEMTAIGANFRILEPTWIAVTGADSSVTINNHPISMWMSYKVEAGEIVRIGELNPGLRSYLCVHGGIDVPQILSSSSTFVSGKWGGLNGKALSGGEVLKFRANVIAPPGLKRAASAIRNLYREIRSLRVTDGPQVDWFTQNSREMFYSSEFEVTSEADRKGIRLKGPQLEFLHQEELVTEGVANGSIQVPFGGQPLILFCEQQTTGGYPKIATIARADWFKIGQLRPGEFIRFERIELDEAWQLNNELEEKCRRMILPV